MSNNKWQSFEITDIPEIIKPGKGSSVFTYVYSGVTGGVLCPVNLSDNANKLALVGLGERPQKVCEAMVGHPIVIAEYAGKYFALVGKDVVEVWLYVTTKGSISVDDLFSYDGLVGSDSLQRVVSMVDIGDRSFVLGQGAAMYPHKTIGLVKSITSKLGIPVRLLMSGTTDVMLVDLSE
jgi:hypothetical protein